MERMHGELSHRHVFFSKLAAHGPLHAQAHQLNCTAACTSAAPATCPVHAWPTQHTSWGRRCPSLVTPEMNSQDLGSPLRGSTYTSKVCAHRPEGCLCTAEVRCPICGWHKSTAFAGYYTSPLQSQDHLLHYSTTKPIC